MKRGLVHVSALAAVLALAASCAAPAATGTAADETAIRAIPGKYSDAFNKGDAAALAALVTEDYHAVLPDGTIVKGRAAFEEAEKTQATQRAGLPIQLNIQTNTVDWLSANAAVAGGTWTLAGLPPGAGPEKGAWVGVMKKGDDGNWRLMTGLVADHQPAPPGK